MLSIFLPHGASLERHPWDGGAIPETAVWFDLVQPTIEEDKVVEQALGIAVPTPEEMQEIEVSSRLYVENGARYMTATLMCNSDTQTPKTTPVTFILSGRKLVTVRYDEPRPFVLIGNKLARHCPTGITGEMVLLELLDAVIDRAADILEKAGAEIERVSHEVFEPEGRRVDRSLTYRYILKTIGRKGDLTGKIRENLVSVGRVVLFLANDAETAKWPKEMRLALKTMQRDVQSLSDHATYLSNKITFLLDAMIGVMSLEQNNVIKIFAVLSVILMPPTVIASIYGMNFKNMPELDWTFGYPMALAIMLAAALGPYVYFKWKRWL